MKVNLAGFNVDTAVLTEMEKVYGKRTDITPEVLSAAYARISRDPRSIDEIRKDARTEVERARKSNSTIIFKMGHHSVAEHAVFNLDIIGVSRYVMEELEKFRLCSYTEKSQRYITLDNDFVIPSEIKNTEFEPLFIDTIKEQNKAYFILFKKLKEYVFDQNKDLAKDPKKYGLLEGWAKEDARYITSLATKSQVGQTINARNLELLLRRFASSPLSEVKALGRTIYGAICDVAPSIVIFHQENDRDSKTYRELKSLSEKLISKDDSEISDKIDEVSLVEYPENGDDLIVAAILHASSKQPYSICKEKIEKLSLKEKENVLKTSWKNMQFYDSMLREFEYANLTYDLVVSSACFGQLKRHRMSTITSQRYDPNLKNTIPESIKNIGMDKFFLEVVEKTNDLYEKINKKLPLVAPYILTNSHRKRVLMRVNARELYHISRLREDAHAQWDIQNLSRKMSYLAKEKMPLTFKLIGGKDKYNDIYKEIYGSLPKVTETALPGKRSIK